MSLGPTAAEKEVHPIERAGFWSSVFHSWVTPVVNISRRTTWTQKMHYNLPLRDDINTNEESFKKAFEKKRGLFGTIISTFKCDLLLGLLWAWLFVLTDYSISILLYFLMKSLQGDLPANEAHPNELHPTKIPLKDSTLAQISKPLESDQLVQFCLLLCLNLLAQTFSAIIQNWNQLH